MTRLQYLLKLQKLCRNCLCSITWSFFDKDAVYTVTCGYERYRIAYDTIAP